MNEPFRREIMNSLHRIQGHVRRWTSVNDIPTVEEKKEEKKILGIHVISTNKYPKAIHSPEQGVFSAKIDSPIANPYEGDEDSYSKYEAMFYGELIECPEPNAYLAEIYDYYDKEDFVFLLCDGDPETSYALVIKEWLLAIEKIDIKNTRSKSVTTYCNGIRSQYIGE